MSSVANGFADLFTTSSTFPTINLHLSTKIILPNIVNNIIYTVGVIDKIKITRAFSIPIVLQKNTNNKNGLNKRV